MSRRYLLEVRTALPALGPGVGMMRIAEQLVPRAHFDDPAEIHIVGCGLRGPGCAPRRNPIFIVYLIYAANDLAITSQNLVKKTRFCFIIA